VFKLLITEINCVHVGGSSNNDDVEILVQCDAGPPSKYPVIGSHSMNSNQVLNLVNNPPTPAFYFDHTAAISVWDRDGAGNTFDAADYLGSGYVHSEGSFELDMKGNNGAHYKIGCEVEEITTANAIPADLYQAIADDLKAWKANLSIEPTLQTVVECTDPDDLKDYLKDILFSEAFTRVNAALAKATKVKAFSIGLLAQVDFIGGLEGVFGIAIDRSDFSFIGVSGTQPSVAVFGGPALVEGLDAGADASLAVGVWFEDTDSIRGRYVGAELTIDEEIGVTGAVFASRADEDAFTEDDESNNLDKVREQAKVAFVGLDVGFDDGGEGVETYFFSGIIPQSACYQTGTYDHMVNLDELHCHDALSISESEHDNIGIKYRVDDESSWCIYPIWNTFAISEDDYSRMVGCAIKFDTKFEISLHIATSQANVTIEEVTPTQTYWYQEDTDDDSEGDYFKNTADVDKSFEDHFGSHKAKYHLHAKLRY